MTLREIGERCHITKPAADEPDAQRDDESVDLLTIQVSNVIQRQCEAAADSGGRRPVHVIKGNDGRVHGASYVVETYAERVQLSRGLRANEDFAKSDALCVDGAVTVQLPEHLAHEISIGNR